MHVPTGGLTIAGGALVSVKNPIYVHAPAGVLRLPAPTGDPY
jgi:hypothetical protein